MRFEPVDELSLFAESVRAAIGEWEPPREPELGTWQDDRDAPLADRLERAGWVELWSDAELLAPAAAGGLELGRAATPACLVDEATLGAPLFVEGRARHGLGAQTLAVPRRRGGLALATPVGELRPESTLDGTGTVLLEVTVVGELEPGPAAACWSAWSVATLGYLAGLAERALELTVEHVRTREQFGASLGSLPAVQSRLADAALAVDALRLLAWGPPEPDRSLRAAELLWAGSACCEVTASAQQLHGASGFALETGLHRLFRRARSTQAWAAAACAAAR